MRASFLQTLNPHDPQDVVDERGVTGPIEIDTTIRRAADAQRPWQGLPSSERERCLLTLAASLEDHTESLTELIVREVGKPYREAEEEVVRAAAVWRDAAASLHEAVGDVHASRPGQISFSRRRPLGVCALVTPWNFPLLIPSWKAAPAIASGNAVVLKPSPQANAVAAALQDLWSAVLPADVCQTVYGRASTVEALIDHPLTAAVSFTGSTAAGRAVAARAGANGTRIQCELGGHNPIVVLADADIDAAVSAIATSAMSYAGQKCTSARRLIVERPIVASVIERLIPALEALVLVGPSSKRCDIGPLISAAARDFALERLAQAGGTVLSGGSGPTEQGFYLQPTLVADADPASRLVTEETFAPILCLSEAKDLPDAIRQANATAYGLVASIFTTSARAVLDFGDAADTGLVRANAPTTGIDSLVPLSGRGASSIGPPELGTTARDFYTQPQAVLIDA